MTNNIDTTNSQNMSSNHRTTRREYIFVFSAGYGNNVTGPTF